VIESFLASWPLFHDTYLAGWLIGALLALVGVLVVARDQIFLGAAVSQASVLGIALGMYAGALLPSQHWEWCRTDAFLSASGGTFAVLGALITGRGGRIGVESAEAVTGWLFALGASLSVLVLAHSPHGLEDVHRLVSSTIIGASAADVLVFAAMLAATVAALVAWRDRLLLLVMDPEMAAAVGVPTALWNRLLSIWLGVAVGFSLRVSGMIYTFACLVLPALVAKNLCREVHAMFRVAVAVCVGAGLAGFVLAHHYDYPPGQMVAGLLCGLLAVAWALRRLRTGVSAD
jgi:ABC-type Mn2+/Zn2+ transport system permease subunit